MTPAVTIVIPTIGRASLATLIEVIDDGTTPIVVVDDRPGRHRPLTGTGSARVLTTAGGEGPAVARNIGWRAAGTEWVAFIDDDVQPGAGWLDQLRADLERAGPEVGGVQGRVVVPLPTHRRPTDRERNVAGLAKARWITADMAYRRRALAEAGGFDLHFPRAYREDADLALRVLRKGWTLEHGERVVIHPVGSAPWWSSIAAQRGNSDDVLMRRVHGPDWRTRAGAGRGMMGMHLATTAALSLTLVAGGLGWHTTRRLAAVLWLTSFARFTVRRVAPGPRTAGEIVTMAVTSALIPPAAVLWHVVGRSTHRRHPSRAPHVAAVLFDRDGTLVHDVPYNGDPGRVEMVDGAKPALDRLRRAGMRVGLITNQSGIGRGLISRAEAESVNRRVEDLAGPFDVIVMCPHRPEDGCACRKPSAGMVEEAARLLGVDPKGCAVVGDILADVQAAGAAGGMGVLVPNPATAPEDVEGARYVADDLDAAVATIMRWSG